MPRKKKELTEALSSLGDAAVDAAKEAAETAGDAAKAMAKMAEPAVRKVRRKTDPAMKKAEKALKETSRRAAAALSPELYVQWAGQEVSCAEVLEKAKADFKAQYKGAVRSCKIYIKPEDGMAYYVISGKEGKVPL